MTQWQAIKMAAFFGALTFAALIFADVMGNVLQEILR
jgi:hypothetical protein